MTSPQTKAAVQALLRDADVQRQASHSLYNVLWYAVVPFSSKKASKGTEEANRAESPAPGNEKKEAIQRAS